MARRPCDDGSRRVQVTMKGVWANTKKICKVMERKEIKNVVGL